MKNDIFASELIEWYHTHQRDLPWRKTKDPYLIWLSEIILQQTRVQQGLPYFYRFVETFPTIDLLANANEHEVLRLWQGLGYYSRARNLHSAAKQIVHELKGIFPESYLELIQLKGVGSYTAAAVASFAFSERVAVVDGNVYRVLARVFGIHTDIASGKGAQQFSKLANELLPEKNSGNYNQAIMEFGALHCTPLSPKCNNCPLASICVAFNENIQHLLPVKSKKIKKQIRYFHYLAFRYQDMLMMNLRTKKDIWQGLYDFCLVEKAAFHDIYLLLQEENIEVKGITISRQSPQYKHILTHQTIFAKFWILDIENKETLEAIKTYYLLQEYNTDQIKALPKPVLIIKFLEQHVF